MQYAIRSLYCVLFLVLSACSPAATPTPFIAPHGPRPSPIPSQTTTPSPSPFPTIALTTILSPMPQDAITPAPIATQTEQETATPGPTANNNETPTASPPLSPTPRGCTDSLKFQADLTYPDGTLVKPGQAIQKQWRILNDGSCDWDETYLLKLVDGYPALAAASPMALYPARAGTKFNLSINFTAPADAGTYRTVWQAFNPQGTAFGEQIYMEVIVKP